MLHLVCIDPVAALASATLRAAVNNWCMHLLPKFSSPPPLKALERLPLSAFTGGVSEYLHHAAPLCGISCAGWYSRAGSNGFPQPQPVG